MRGVILAGGKGTRMLPATRVINKNMIPILNVPMIVYSIETLKKFGITNILIVSGGDHIGSFADFLGDGSEYGVELCYKVQQQALGVAHALGVAEDFIHDGQPFMVTFADNIFDIEVPFEPFNLNNATIFFKEVEDPRRFGVAAFEGKELVGIEEKPATPKSNLAVMGLCVYPPDVFEVIHSLTPSARGEYEISDVNDHYVKNKRCDYRIHEGFWKDAGTPESMLEVMQYMHQKQKGK